MNHNDGTPHFDGEPAEVHAWHEGQGEVHEEVPEVHEEVPEETHEPEASEAEHIEELAEHALDSVVEMHREEEETERVEALADALSDVAEATTVPAPEEVREEHLEELPPEEEAAELGGSEAVEPPQEKDEAEEQQARANPTQGRRGGFAFQRGRR
jgi:hypothetical protein